MEKKEGEGKKYKIERETQIAMMKFFLKTSIPRMIKKEEETKGFCHNMESEKKDD